MIDVDHTENYATVRTSNYANFAENTLPQGTGSMVCIASYYETSSSVTWQFLIRSISELTFDGYYTALPYFQEFGTDFGSYTTYSVAGDQVWEIAYRTAKMTGNVNNVNHANEDWLLSSPVAVTGMEHAKVRVNYAAQYQNSNTEDVTLQISKDYVAGMDPLDPSVHWTQLNVTLPNTSGWDDFQTIEASLDEFIGQTVTVAIKFLSSESQSRTMEIKYISVEEGVASSGGGGGTGGEVQSLPYVQLFETGFGTYMPYDVMGDQSWAIEYKSANMTGYVSGTNNANEDWLISSPVDLSGVSDAKMTMSYIGRYFTNINNDVTVWASTDYTYGNDPTTATWTQVPSTLSEGNNWTDFLTAEVALTDYVGQTVTLAVKYLSTDVKAGTMEIKSITIEEGSAGGGGGGGGTGGEVQNLPYTQSFTSEFGSYITKDVMGAQSWVIDFRTAKMTGYVSGTNNANEDWLISSPVAITGVSDAKMTITYIARYFSSINSDITIWASTNYTWDSDPSTATWTQVPSTLSEGNNWNDFLTAEISLTDYVGQTVTLAVKYLSTDIKAGTLEIQSITIQEGTGITPTPPPTPGNPEGSGTAEDPYNVAAGIVNQGQENVWVHGYIVGAVKSGNSTVNSNDQVNWAAPFDLATNVLIADDPNCNEVALCVIVNLPSNKPLRTQVNLMDHPENLGKMLAVNGKLRTYFGQAGLRDSGGTESDFVLEGGSPTPPPTPPTGIFSETFASGQGAFVIQDVVMPSELSYVWAHNSQYSCMKASAYVGQNYETESWLISPSIDLTGVSTASLSFEQAVNYASPTGSLFVMISTNYMDNVTTATWETLAISSWPAGNNWTFINSTADLTSYVGQTVTIAFKYTSTSSSSATWEVKNFVVE